jgi:hypothetical protein
MRRPTSTTDHSARVICGEGAPECSVLVQDGSAENGLGATGGMMLGW